jgi:hypothetical protein
VLGGAGGYDERLLGVVVVLVVHLGLLGGRWLERSFGGALIHPPPAR